MRKFALAFLCFALMPFARADEPHFWTLTSPDHEQTFAYGMETNRVWAQRGHHLQLQLNFTNDPFVDWDNPRQYDNFTFSFPNVKVGADGNTFYYQTSGGRSIPVAKRKSVFLGTEIKLLPNAELKVLKPHGYLTLVLLIEDPAKGD
jgi:hypothetical protein